MTWEETFYTILWTNIWSGVTFVPKVLPEVCLVQHCVWQLIELLCNVRSLRCDTKPCGQDAHYGVRRGMRAAVWVEPADIPRGMPAELRTRTPAYCGVFSVIFWRPNISWLLLAMVYIGARSEYTNQTSSCNVVAIQERLLGCRFDPHFVLRQFE